MTAEGWRSSRIIEAVDEDGRAVQIVIGEFGSQEGIRMAVRIGENSPTALLDREHRHQLTTEMQALNREMRRYW